MWNFLTSVLTMAIALVVLGVLVYFVFFTEFGLFLLVVALVTGMFMLVTRDKV